VVVLVLGLAVPVTASFIISAVSPPTALSSVAAAAITGGDAFKTMMLTLRYTLPAFLVPFAFVLSPSGEGLLLQGPILASPGRGRGRGGRPGRGHRRLAARPGPAARAGPGRPGRAVPALP